MNQQSENPRHVDATHAETLWVASRDGDEAATSELWGLFLVTVESLARKYTRDTRITIEDAECVLWLVVGEALADYRPSGRTSLPQHVVGRLNLRGKGEVQAGSVLGVSSRTYRRWKQTSHEIYHPTYAANLLPRTKHNPKNGLKVGRTSWLLETYLAANAIINRQRPTEFVDEHNATTVAKDTPHASILASLAERAGVTENELGFALTTVSRQRNADLAVIAEAWGISDKNEYKRILAALKAVATPADLEALRDGL